MTSASSCINHANGINLFLQGQNYTVLCDPMSNRLSLDQGLSMDESSIEMLSIICTAVHHEYTRPSAFQI